MRLATEGDLDAVRQLLKDCIAEMRRAGIDQWDEIYPSRETLLADIRHRTMHVTFAETALVGALVLNVVQNAEWSQAAWAITDVPTLAVHRVMVHPTRQGRGVACDLMRSAEAWGRANGYGAIRLDAFCANPRVLRLYRGLDYRDAGGATFRKGPFRCFEKRIVPLPASE